jgi:hypothetical protein
MSISAEYILDDFEKINHIFKNEAQLSPSFGERSATRQV